MKLFIGGPNFQINKATAKNLKDLPIMDANINSEKLKCAYSTVGRWVESQGVEAWTDRTTVSVEHVECPIAAS